MYYGSLGYSLQGSQQMISFPGSAPTSSMAFLARHQWKIYTSWVQKLGKVRGGRNLLGFDVSTNFFLNNPDV